MNIKDAKEQIKNAIVAYFSKDENGDYVLPIEKQRPVFLMGPPGIGKTAIMQQIASEVGVGLLSYSMTHHTRQSALGLPFIEHKVYDGKEYAISEYTMSEIIASVYEMMETSGVKEGILFLDEINCVSETLAPIMLQFLQYKIFGRHRVPDGWIVVTAGNPPEYNNSVREFDIVTWDRLKRVDVEPDYDVWKEYAYNKQVHPSIITYLDIKKQDFYHIESTVDGKTFVTARGWDDLSQMICLYEKNNITVNEKLISQYLQNPKIAKDFATYYDLFLKYKSDYQVNDILEGKANKTIRDRAMRAKFDERISLIGLMLDATFNVLKEVIDEEEVIVELLGALKQFKQTIVKSKDAPDMQLEKLIAEYEKTYDSGKKSGSKDADELSRIKKVIAILNKQKMLVKGIDKPNEAFAVVKKDFDDTVKNLKKFSEKAEKKLANMIRFASEVFYNGQGLLIIITELTANMCSAKFISKYGCDEYFKHNKELLVFERQQEISRRIEDLNL